LLSKLLVGNIGNGPIFITKNRKKVPDFTLFSESNVGKTKIMASAAETLILCPTVASIQIFQSVTETIGKRTRIDI